MSESTFSQSASPTTGLTNYSVEPGVKELYPAPTVKGRSRNRHTAWRKRFPNRGIMKKESTTMNANHTIEAMVDTLRKSVTSIAASDAADRDGLLTKSFDEFLAALDGEVQERLSKAAPAFEEPLFKGLGCIGRVANLVGNLASQVATIQQGYEGWQARDGNPPPDADPASPDLVEHLEDLLAHAEGILRVAVNEHCEPLDEGDDGEGYHVVMVPMASGAGDVAVKTDLPTDLAKYATDPEGVDAFFAEMAFSTLARAGVDTELLGKALASGALAKDASMMGGAQTTPSDAGGASPGAGSDGSDGTDGTDAGDPLDTLARLAALMMIQVDYLKQMVDGTNEPSDPSGENSDPPDANGADGSDASANAGAAGGASASNPTDGGAPGQNNFGKSADLKNDEVLAKALRSRGIDLDALAKLAESNAEMKGRLDEFETLTSELLAKAAPAKAPLVSSAVHKSAEDALVGQHPQEDLSKLSPEGRALAKMKEQHQTGGRPYSG